VRSPGYAAQSAQEVLAIFERAHPADSRARDAIRCRLDLARGGKRGQEDCVTLRGRRSGRPRDCRVRGRGRCGASSDVRGIRWHTCIQLADAHQ